jgi:hypothetical protein
MYRGNAFVPEPCANLGEALHHERDRRPREGHEHGRRAAEFLTSTDERFRPVKASNGPDGALYLVDMYRGIIQHQSFLTHYLIANIEARKLEQPFNMGRIWRIVPDRQRPKSVKVSKRRENAHARQRLGARHRAATHRRVRRCLRRARVEGDAAKRKCPIAREHALWTLDGLAAITPDLVKAALADKASRSAPPPCVWPRVTRT